MKKLLILLPLIVLSGCKTGPMGHAIFTAAITTGEQVALVTHPEIAPDLRAGAAVVCAVANGTNATPEAIVAALEAAHITNVLSRVVLNSSLSIFNTVVASVGTNNTAQVKLYAQDLCNGLTAGLPPGMTALRHNRPAVIPPHLK